MLLVQRVSYVAFAYYDGKLFYESFTYCNLILNKFQKVCE